MSRRGRKAWNECYDLMQDHELAPDTFMLKIEVLNLLHKSLPKLTELEIGIVLLVIADSNMHQLVEQNG